MPKVSIVIPVYNCEAFLPECIASLRAQTLTDIEMIFVCDGSPDGSLEILRAAQRADERVLVIDFGENRGVSAARNAGIEAARGEFVGFCDGDDWVEPRMFERLYEAARAARSDIAFCRVYKHYGEKSENVPIGFAEGERFDAAAIRERLVPEMLSRRTDSDELPLSGYTPRNLFRRGAIGDTRFRREIRYAEDLLFIVECMLKADAAVAVDEALYHYRFHAGSVTKRYSPHVPASHDLSNDALETLLGDNPECMRRMRVRRRKMAITAVRNFCFPGSPFGFFARVREARAYMRRSDVRGWFRELRLAGLPLQLAVKLFLLRHRMALVSCLLFTFVFDRV